MSKQGIDVSRWQKGFKLSSAVAEGFDTVIIKAGGADSGLYKDSQFDNFYAQADQLKMNIGAYYFGQAFSVADAEKEANHFISILQGKRIDRVFYDVEAKMLNQGKQHLTDIISKFCSVLTGAGYICGIYTSESQFNSRFDDNQLKQYSHWVARYSKSAPKLNSGANIDIWQYGGEINYIRSNKIAGTVVDQDYIYIVDWNSPVDIPDVSNIMNKSVTELAEEVLQGKYGNGENRKLALGVRYKEVQAEVERLLKEKNEKPVEKSIDQLAIEVLAGLHGNGIARVINLGSKYKAVQTRVEEIIAERKQTKKTYVVQKGDTLSAIARKYKTTTDALQKANNIADKNRIYIGQLIVIV